MTLLESLHTSSFFILAISGVFIFVSIVKAKKIENMILSLDLFSTYWVVVIAFLAMNNRQSYFIDGALILSVISFLGTLTFARYLTPRLRRKS